MAEGNTLFCLIYVVLQEELIRVRKEININTKVCDVECV